MYTYSGSMASHTSFTLNMNEDVLFKHPSSVKGIPGMLYLTTLRVTWVASSSSQAAHNILLPWAQIKDDKYSKITDEKQRAMIRLVSVQGDTHVLSLTGAPVALRGELERAKVAVKRCRQGSGGGDKVKKTARVKSSSSSSSSSSSNSNSKAPQHMRTENERREQILSADTEMRALHQELVGGGVVGESEFWEARSKLLSDSEGKDMARRKGISSSLLCDVQHAEVSGNGARNFQLTPEAVVDIFLMYPHVLEEYNLKVPVEMSKDEFWVRYFQHEVFAKGTSRPQSSNSSIIKSQPGQLTYGEVSSTGVHQQNLSGRVSRDMDLTQTYGDYHATERPNPEDSSFKSTDTTAKYKRKGSLVLEQQRQDQQGSVSNSSTTLNSEGVWETNAHILNEENPDVDNIPLHLSRPKIRRLGNEHSVVTSSASFDHCYPSMPSPDDELDTHVHSRRSRYQASFPSTALAIKVLQKEQEKLHSFTDVARQATIQEGRGGSYQVGMTAQINTLVPHSAQTADQTVTSSIVSTIEHMQTTPELEHVSILRLFQNIFVMT